MTWSKKFRRAVLGEARLATESHVFHKLSLVAFLAWVGLGADGISSACYGPEEAFLALEQHHYLALILALMAAGTVLVISASYIQIINLFPTGGGGYLVASKLLSPSTGMVAGCALTVDYVLTIAISVAAGVDALFSFLPADWLHHRLLVAAVVLAAMVILNLRGVRESVLPLVPVFLVFIICHGAVIVVGICSHAGELPGMLRQTGGDLHAAVGELGGAGVALLLLRAYSLGGGTYTGIEAVSNGLPILREPRAQTGRKTMLLMAVSLAFLAGGLIVVYLLYHVQPDPQRTKTLNAVLFESVAQSWPGGKTFVVVAMLSEALILLVAAQTGFLDGPRVLANMALDGWVPSRFALLSDRLITQNGVLLMGVSSLLLLWLSRGSVRFLVVLYSINVFLTFTLSQLGMVIHWWRSRRSGTSHLGKILVNGVGFLLTAFLLVSVVVLKFAEGGWLTLVITGTVVLICLYIRYEYRLVGRELKRLDEAFRRGVSLRAPAAGLPAAPVAADGQQRQTAVVLVSGYNGVGLHTLFNVFRIYPGFFQHFVFLQVGLIDAGRFKGIAEIDALRQQVQSDLERYVQLVNAAGYSAQAVCAMGTDVVEEVEQQAQALVQQYPHSVFFTGQLIFPRDTWITRVLHNYTSFAVQRRLYRRRLPVVILPLRV